MRSIFFNNTSDIIKWIKSKKSEDEAVKEMIIIANSFYRSVGKEKQIKETCRKIYKSDGNNYKDARVLMSELV